ncbi:hypothetical protein CU100_17585 [Phyllobacterium endophyticum]|uniref:Uncharacterized protein n=1 Tax=Phyllobacterium endophyticum TaxID=1149773 RepID=A0A2P7AS84_9HYPH|nr:hypothetical protein CU100_17585 [Phyllobacterium endophyticum]
MYLQNACTTDGLIFDTIEGRDTTLKLFRRQADYVSPTHEIAGDKEGNSFRLAGSIQQHGKRLPFH